LLKTLSELAASNKTSRFVKVVKDFP